MKLLLKKYRKFIKRIHLITPYALPTQVPTRFKKVWFQLLLKSSRKYLLIYLYSISIGKFWFLVQLYVLKTYHYLSPKEHNKLAQLVLIDNISARRYFFHNLQDTTQWELRHNYLRMFNLSHCILSWTASKEANILNNKLLFYILCQNHQFPTPSNYVLITNNGWQQFTTYPWVEKKDFVLKRTKGSKGIGFVRFVYDESRKTYKSSKRTQLSIHPNQMERYLKLWFQKKSSDYLIQEKLNNHQAFSHLSNDALAVIRILSMIDKKGAVQLFRPIFQMPQGDTILNYYHAGALVAPIDNETGRLGKLISPHDTLLSFHPETKVPIEDFEIPYWQPIKAEIKRFHSLLSNQPLIGWDIVITPNGFSFLEGNISPSLDIHQKPPFQPFIPSEFYDLFCYHLEKTLQNRKGKTIDEN